MFDSYCKQNYLWVVEVEVREKREDFWAPTNTGFFLREEARKEARDLHPEYKTRIRKYYRSAFEVDSI
jgi:hypothetical protein